VLVLGGRSGTPVMWVDIGVLLSIVLPVASVIGRTVVKFLERK
jgi:hypothetical protein